MLVEHRFILLVWIAFVPGVLAQVTRPSAVIDGGGNFSTNVAFQHFSAIGQGGPVGFNSSSANLHFSGFINTFVLHTNLDNDADGVIDENDPDDDNDSLGDAEEIAGTHFDPETGTNPFLADSDGDGADDDQESAAGTNPQDLFSVLAITFAETDGMDNVIEWSSRGGKQYQVLRAASVGDLSEIPVVVDTVTAVGGLSPWFETISISTNASPGPNAFYRIRVHQ